MRSEHEIDEELERLVAKARQVHHEHHCALRALSDAIGDRRYRGPEAESLAKLNAQLDVVDALLSALNWVRGVREKAPSDLKVAGDPVCVCGHARSAHENDNRRACLVTGCLCGPGYAHEGFVSKYGSHPAPALTRQEDQYAQRG